MHIEFDVRPLRFVRRHWQAVASVLVTAVLAVAALVACTSDSSSDKEAKSRNGTYDQLVAKQPAHSMTYSPTRDTINFWIDTWGKQPNKLAYVYLQNSEGKLIGYYVLKGLPVSYCAALTPTQQVAHDDHGNVVVNAPSVDGVFYSGGQCAAYYGRDATTNAYLEYTVGLGINVLLYDQPLPNHPNVPNLGPTKLP
jgi:hypothetical protein